MGLFQTSKQLPVSLPEICAPRAELMRIFDKAAKNQYIYVHAPAGYGKTISALLWLRKSQSKTIWVSLDAYDNALVLFYRLMCMSMLSVIPHDEDILNKVKSSSFNADPVGCTLELLALLNYEDIRYALVLDDFHLITNEEIKKSLSFMMKRLPLSVTVIIISRNNPSASLESLAEQRKLSFVNSSDLAFSSDEIRKHFTSYGRFITEEEADNLYSYTEGWIIALNTLAVSGQIDVPGKSASLSFHSYMEKNIWDKLDEVMREFLLKTSVPDKFTFELCCHLTEDGHCGRNLDTLIAGNINISLIGTEYRYHNLFLEFLRCKLDQSVLDRRALNKKTAEYYLGKGDFLTAKNYAMKSGDAASISQVVRCFYSLKTFSIDEYIEVHKLYGMDSIPEMICERAPLLYIPRIFFCYTLGDIKGAGYFTDKLRIHAPQIAETHPEVMEHVNSMIMLDCRLRLSEFPASIKKLPEAAHEHKDLQSPTFTCQLPFLHRCVRDFYELTDAQLRKSIAAFSSAIIKENVGIMFEGAKAGLLMEQNKLRDALDIAVGLKNSIDGSMSAEFVYAIYILTAEIYRLLRQRDKYEAVIKEVKEYITLHTCQYLLKNVSAYESRTLICKGDKAAAEKWLKNYYVDGNSFNEFYKIYRNFTTVRAYILLEKLDVAFDALNRIRTLAESYDRPQDVAEADVLLSITEWCTGKRKEARIRLQNTLSAIHPHGFIRMVANEGKDVLPILAAVIKRLEKENGESSGDLYKFAKEVNFAAYDQSKHYRGITYHSGNTSKLQLSPRQKHVLELLAKGYKNAEIANETGLSLNTIRTHTKLTYQKLEVNNSLDAVTRAKQLGILD